MSDGLCVWQADRSLWEGMQEKAEEKKKGYACVVWSADRIDRNKLRELEQLCLSGADRDEEGVPCIEVRRHCISLFLFVNVIDCSFCVYVHPDLSEDASASAAPPLPAGAQAVRVRPADGAAERPLLRAAPRHLRG